MIGTKTVQAINANGKLSLVRRVKRHWQIMLMAIPGLAFLIFFSYMPMYGIQIGFRNFKIAKGLVDSDWVGLKNFLQLTKSYDFKRAFTNTITLSVLELIFTLPFPVLVALLLNELRIVPYKRVLQTVSYIPHFISWIVVAGIFTDILSPSTGIVNQLINVFGGESIYFMADRTWARPLIVITALWKGFGWGTIVYLSALTAVDSNLYEAAAIDGAGRLRQVIHVALPAISGTFIVMLIMALGRIMTGVSFDQIYAMMNSVTEEKLDILSTFVYRQMTTQFNYSFTTAAGIFQSVIGAVLLTSTNYICKRWLGRSMY